MDRIVYKEKPVFPVKEKDVEMVTRIHLAFENGHDAEVKLKPDGTITVLEVHKKKL